mgnify:CR=1 FL=1
MTENSAAPIISIKNVWKYFGSLPALQDVCLDIAPGERVVIIGPSGSGKSTLLRLIVGLDQDYQGQILLDRQPVRGPGLGNAVLAIALLNIPIFARLARASAASVWAQNYVLAARACGKSRWRITWEHVLPHCAGVLMAQASSQFALAILAEAALSYLGLGVQAPTPSWGRMLSEAQSLLYQAPQLALYPGLAIALAVLGFQLVGEGLRQLLAPPTQGRSPW